MPTIFETDVTTRDASRWEELLPVRRSVFGSAGYASVMKEHAGYDCRLFSYTHGEDSVQYPLFGRSTDTLGFAHQLPAGASDFLTPEYTGPLGTPEISAAAASGFRSAFGEYCKQERVIAEFAHVHPWHSDPKLLPVDGLKPSREIVYIDVTLPEEQLWQSSYQHSCRKNIRRAEREGVRLLEATGPGDIAEFHRLYIGTMDRNAAEDKYYFPLEFFKGIFERMPQHARFVLAEYKGKLIAGTLYMHDDQDVYSFLGGADQEHSSVRPTNAIIHDTVMWAQREGKSRLILGGGYRPDDGIFRFKSTFSPLRANFSTFGHVHDQAAYQHLCDARRSSSGETPIENESFFPLYRA